MPVEEPTLDVAPSTIVCRLASGNLLDATPAAVVDLLFTGLALPVAVIAADDKVLIQDTDDSDTLKTVTTQSIADLIGAGDVQGPAVAVNDALCRFDLTTGKLIQNSVGILTDAGALSGLTTINMSGALTVGGTVDGRDVAADGGVLDGIEPGADITDEANVLPALDGAAIPAATVAVGDLVLIQDIDDANNLAVVTAQSIADLASGGSGVGPNLLINGNFNISQRGTTFVDPASGEYTLDRWNWGDNAGVGVVTITQDTDVPDGFSEFSLGVDVTTADAAIAAGDLYQVTQRIEGLNIIPTAIGAADAADLTLTFLVRGTVTGIHCVSFRNNGGARSYVAEYTINVADTWEFKTVTLTGDLIGTWLKDTGLGMLVDFTLAAGTTFQTAANTWTAGNFVATANQVNQMSSTANFFKISRVKLEVGSVASAFTPRPFGDELQLCKRYFQKTFPYAVAPADNAGGNGFIQYVAIQSAALAQVVTWNFPVQMRVVPSVITFFNYTAGVAGFWRNGAGADSAVVTSLAGQDSDSRLYLRNAQVPADNVGDQIGCHATVQAEL